MIVGGNWKLRPCGRFGLPALLLITAIIYWPALDSRFLGDDYTNLRHLDGVGEYGYAYYIFGSGRAGPAGRPIALASFAVQHDSWPDSPFDFKLVNLFIHLANGCLIFIICRLLGGMALPGPYGNGASLATTALWLLHPIQLSTTLYAVQRMTLLSAFFTLLGIVVYLSMRVRHRARMNPYRDGMLGVLLWIVMLLAVFSKENGILLPVYLLCIELTLLRNYLKPPYWTRWTGIFLIFPIACLIGYLGLNFNAQLGGYTLRGYSMFERVLTEAVVLTDYLKLFLMPDPSAFSLYYDDYGVVTSDFSGKFLMRATVLAFLSVSACLAVNKIPVYSFAILWFLGGHALESTYLNLEIYFEHRNYLPLFGVVFFLAWGAAKLFDRTKKKIVLIPCLAYLGFTVTITVLEVDLWSKPALQIVEWSKNRPDSIRGRLDLYNLYVSRAEYQSAKSVIEELKLLEPGLFYPYVHQIFLDHCKVNIPYNTRQWQQLLEIAAAGKPPGPRLVPALDNLVLAALKKTCPSLEPENLKRLLFTLIHNRNYGNYHVAVFYDFLSSLEIMSGNLEKAITYLRNSNDLLPQAAKDVREIKFLYAAGKLQEAEANKARLLALLERQGNAFIYKKMLETINKY
jgi:hypothetical protein